MTDKPHEIWDGGLGDVTQDSLQNRLLALMKEYGADGGVIIFFRSPREGDIGMMRVAAEPVEDGPPIHVMLRLVAETLRDTEDAEQEFSKGIKYDA